MLDSHELTAAARSPRPAWLDSARAHIANLLRSPAAWFYAIVYVLAVAYLFVSGQNPVGSLVFDGGILVFVLLTLLITRGVQPIGAENTKPTSSSTIRPCFSSWTRSRSNRRRREASRPS